ncbi:MAG: 50S ribosomal protein L25/general stress protein Ctc [Sulfuricellaceae bacterium]|nr:50S ribosomal protein L25/general stress protein Ctc [Sulfuricellaceae bacterium]
MKNEFNATLRTVQGTGASRRLRHAGKTPAIVYGAGKDVVVIELDHNEIYHALRHEVFHSTILTMSLEGKTEQVLLRDYQMHPFRQQVQHVDFQRVDPNQKIHMKVPLHCINADIAPGVKLTGSTVNHVMTEAEVSCLPKDLPEFVEVDLANLAAGHSIHMSEVKLPKGVEFVLLAHGNDAAVVTIPAPRGGSAEVAESAA